MALGFYRLVIFIAAIVLAATSLWSVWSQFNPYAATRLMGWPQVTDSGVEIGAEKASNQFKTTAPDAITTFTVMRHEGDTLGSQDQISYSLIPIILQDKGKELFGGFGSGTYYASFRNDAPRRANGLLPRNCSTRYASNILIYNHETNEIAEIFADEEIAITNFLPQISSENPHPYVLIEYVKEDTDKDEKLSCNDFRSLAIFDVVEQKLSMLDLGGESIWQPSYISQKNMNLIGVGVDENGDGLHDRTNERVRIARIDPATKAVTFLTP